MKGCHVPGHVFYRRPHRATQHELSDFEGTATTKPPEKPQGHEPVTAPAVLLSFSTSWCGMEIASHQKRKLRRERSFNLYLNLILLASSDWFIVFTFMYYFVKKKKKNPEIYYILYLKRAWFNEQISAFISLLMLLFGLAENNDSVYYSGQMYNDGYGKETFFYCINNTLVSLRTGIFFRRLVLMYIPL